MQVVNSAVHQVNARSPGAPQRPIPVSSSVENPQIQKSHKRPAERIIQGELLEKRSTRTQQSAVDAVLDMVGAKEKVRLHDYQQRAVSIGSQQAIKQYQTVANVSLATQTTGVSLDQFA